MTDFGKTEYIKCRDNEKIRIAIMFQVASYWASIESFYDACKENENIDVRIFYINETSVEKVQVEHSDEFLINKGIPFEVYSEKLIDEFQPHAALYQPPYDTAYRNPNALSLHLKNKGIRIIYIPYGIEISDTEDAHYNHFHTYVVKNAWRIYTFSEIMKTDYYKYCPNRNAVRALGLPKFDSLIKNLSKYKYSKCTDCKKKILWKLHFPKLIYDGMTRKQVTPYISEYIKFAQEIDSYKDVHFVVMPHPMFFSQTIDCELAKQAHDLFQILQNKANVIIDRDDDYRPSLYSADAIIIDRSALMVEAGLCNVPVLLMKNDDYDEPPTDGIKQLVDSYEQGTYASDMDRFVREVCNNNCHLLIKKINDCKDASIPFLDGKSGIRIADDIVEGIKNSMNSEIKVLFLAQATHADTIWIFLKSRKIKKYKL